MGLRVAVIGISSLAVVVWLSAGNVVAQGAAALTGVVSSQQEGEMEGVLVTVRPNGGNHTVTVVSDARGRFSFPRTHVPSGQYAVSIRALGYDLTGANLVEVPAGGTATLDLQLQPTADLSDQLTSLDWISLFPLTSEEKDKLAHQGMSCNYCHSYRRIVNSRHDAAGLVRAMERMKTYYPDGTASSDDGRAGIEHWTTFGDSSGRLSEDPQQAGIGSPFWPYSGPEPVPMTEFAEIFAKVNLGSRATYPFELRPVLPRPTGRGTRVIITQWDLPRKDTVAHDSAVDPQGNIWYGDEGANFIGVLNPKTNTFKEYPLVELPPEHLAGSRDIALDEDGNVWFPMRVEGGAAYMTRLDPQTGELTTFDGVYAQFISEGPGNTIWSLGSQTTSIDAESAAVIGEFPGVSGYQKVVSSTGMVCGATGAYVDCLDTRTSDTRRYELPSGPNAYGRRGKMDPQDRYWFAQYNADQIAMLDLRTDQLQEWPLRKYATPYTTSMPDMNGDVYAGSNMSERIMRLDPRTGEVVEYLMPTELDTKEIHIDPSSSERPVILFTNVRNARVVRVEPLD